MTRQFTLISHPLCPYVQRAAIVLTEKGMAFERIDIDLAHKPDWFLEVSPLGKTPVLLVDGHAIFESAVICEYLDETTLPAMHPQDALVRARHRGWVEFGSSLLNGIGAFYNAVDEASLQAKASELRSKWAQLEAALAAGPYFDGEAFTLVDVAFGPVFRYFDVFESIVDFDFFEHMPRVLAWRRALQQRPSVKSAVVADYAARLRAFLLARQSALSARITALEVA